MPYGLPYQGFDPGLMQALQGIDFNRYMQAANANAQAQPKYNTQMPQQGMAQYQQPYVGNMASGAANIMLGGMGQMAGQQLGGQQGGQQGVASPTKTQARYRPNANYMGNRMGQRIVRPKRRMAVRPQAVPPNNVPGSSPWGKPGHVASFLSNVGAGGGNQNQQQVGGNYSQAIGINGQPLANPANRQQRFV